jgi:hypothetical protein
MSQATAICAAYSPTPQPSTRSLAGVKIKFEIVHDGRIDLDPVALGQTVGGVRVLSVVDMAATKLLANDDRWADSSVHCRDVIDLAMLDAGAAAMATASAKVRGPYPSAIRSMNRAIDHLLGDPSPLPKYMQALGMSPSLHSDIVFKLGKLNGVQQALSTRSSAGALIT